MSCQSVFARPRRSYGLFVALLLAATFVGCDGSTNSATNKTVASPAITKPTTVPTDFRGIVVRASEATAEAVNSWNNSNWNAIVLEIKDESDTQTVEVAAKQIAAAGLSVEYFFEVARAPQLADEHPEWMASLQGHDEWQRLHPDFPKLTKQQVAKTYPWVPICYEESFAAQLERTKKLIGRLPAPQRVWLHDLQGAPSACGCGHPLCRWTGDYGSIHTAKPLGDSAAADFISAVQKAFPSIEFIPVWATECEEADEHEACGGVGCFNGICWKAWTRQLVPISARCPTLGVSCFYKAHERDLSRYGETAAWIGFALDSFSSVPKKKGTEPVPSQRLVAVIQGWDVSAAEIAAQETVASKSAARGVLLVTTPVEQSWQPRVYDLDKKN
jgi:hypothetical protein